MVLLITTLIYAFRFSTDPFKDTKLPLVRATTAVTTAVTTTTIAKARTTTRIKTKITRIATTKMITTTTVTPYTYVDKNLLEQLNAYVPNRTKMLTKGRLKVYDNKR